MEVQDMSSSDPSNDFVAELDQQQQPQNGTHQSEDSLPFLSSLVRQFLPLLNTLISLLPLSPEQHKLLRDQDPRLLLCTLILATTFVLFLFIRILSPSRSRSSLAPVVLTGPCGAGKTGRRVSNTQTHNLCADAHAHTHAHTHPHTHTHTLTRTHTHTYIYACARTHTHTHIYTRAHAHTHTHTHAHTHTHIHIHTHANSCIFKK